MATGTAPMGVYELQPSFQRLPDNPCACLFFANLRYTSHGSISGGYP